MKCPECGASGINVTVLDSQLNPEQDYLRRRLDCNQCQNRFITYEITLPPEVAEQLISLSKKKRVTWGQLLGEVLSGTKES